MGYGKSNKIIKKGENMVEDNKNDIISLIAEDEKKMAIPLIQPLMPVRDVVLFTDMLLPLFIGREKSVRAIEEALLKDKFVLLATQKNPNFDDPKPDEIHTTGTVARIIRILKLPDGRMKALVHGVMKAKIVEYIRKKSFYRVKLKLIKEKDIKKISLETEAFMRNIRENSEKVLSFRGEMTSDVCAILESIDNPGKLADLVASNLKLHLDESQNLLEIIDPIKRLKKVNDLLIREANLSAMQAKIQTDVRNEISKNQKDFFLKEQIKAMTKELDEGDEKSQEIEKYRKKIQRAQMPWDAKQESQKQLARLEKMHLDSAEATIVRTYLDRIIELPWNKSTKDELDIINAKKKLDRDHFALGKVKDRILEFLSVRKLNSKIKGPILCFVGPPGVGKTSLGQSIAKAMKRKFVRISLGGIKDEAEIRGHRRTYVGALPGRILQGIKRCGKNNPVFMMDEVDKIFADFRGDPSSALLEVLDPEQNNSFSDHYLNLPFDLSNVMFILTANIVDTIPSALLDRLEIIKFSGYTEEEKKIIAKKYLIPRQIKENGLTSKLLSISPGSLSKIIKEYTSEAGLRNLEREIAAICRKAARNIAEGNKEVFQITQKNIHKLLGPPKYLAETIQEKSQIGLSTGLAWTQAGGEVLHIEASFIKGKGNLIVTGQLGNIMQESAKTALSYAKTNYSLFGYDKSNFENLDIHIHVPAGAIPKDGPSAGIAMATALISVMANMAVSNNIAMTGEITLRGRVLPIGGLREKALGALRSGINTIIFPEKNQNDLIEIPDSVKQKIRFIPVQQMSEVISIALGNSNNFSSTQPSDENI